jgi:4-diphosphocytidyl-2-C-methyl-D-erythritol kinase
MKALFDILAPAKLNLFLHIIGRRSDGYHLLQSAFMLIDWCDTLHFELRTDGHISREDLNVSLPENDLIVRAAKALQAAGSTALGAHIGVRKNIPSQAGMGGGSSDAASTLLALNRLWNLNLPLSALIAIGLKLGADVPFFLHGHNAWVEGIGEKITPIRLPHAQFLVAKPFQGVETSQIFSHPDLKRDTETAIISGFAKHPFEFGRNDLQCVAQTVCQGITDTLKWMASLEPLGFEGRMTGSGSAVFAALSDDTKWLTEPRGAPEKTVVRLCCNLEHHPLLGWAGS